MASLEKRNATYRLVVWYEGRRLSRSLRTQDRREAEALRYRAETTLRLVLQHIIPLPPGADLISFLLSQGQALNPSHKNGRINQLGDLFDEFDAKLSADSLEASTRRCLQVHIRHFRRVLGPSFRVHSITHADLQRYVDTRARCKGRRSRKLSRTTIKKEIATLNTIWRWARNHDLVHLPLPKDGLKYPKESEGPPFQTIDDVLAAINSGHLTPDEQADAWDAVYLTSQDVKKVLEHVRRAARHPSILPMFATAAFTGARCSELRRSRLEDVNLRDGLLWLRERKRVPGRRSLRAVPILGELNAILEAWINSHPGGGFTFCLEDVPKSRKVSTTPRPLSSEEARHHFHQTLRHSRWEKLRGWHVFRHTFCSLCAAAGTDQRLIDEWTGHQTESMRKRYRHLFPGQQRREIERVFSEHSEDLDERLKIPR